MGVGLRVGFGEGLTVYDGAMVGFGLGEKVGFLVGFADVVGLTVYDGAAEGGLVGVMEGFGEGAIVGANDEGVAVGFGEGFGVGFADG